MAAESDAPTTELEALVADLSATGSVVFVFGVGSLTTHLRGRTRPVFRGPAERRWWHVEHWKEEKMRTCSMFGDGRGWDRTSDLPRVKRVGQVAVDRHQRPNRHCQAKIALTSAQTFAVDRHLRFPFVSALTRRRSTKVKPERATA